jgi:hypothetical protein
MSSYQTINQTNSNNQGTIYSDFNYETLRNKNLQEIQNYYNTVLSKYNAKYSEYITNSSSTDQSLKDQAQYALTEGDLPALTSYLSSIISTINSSIATDTSNLTTLETKIQNDTKLIQQNRDLINKLNVVLSNKQDNNSKNNDSYNETRNDNETKYNIQIAIVLLNVLLLCSILGLMYLAYTSTSTTSSNSYSNSNSNSNNKTKKLANNLS